MNQEKEYKTCGKCEKTFPMDNDNFYNNAHSNDKFYHYCKTCDDKTRTERYQTKASHNIPKSCKYCNKTFYAELHRVKRGRAIFCNMSCKARFEKSGTSPLIDNRGSRNPNARLTEKQIEEIREAVANKEKHADIAKRYKISVSHVSNIKAGRLWKKKESTETKGDANEQETHL